jgi:hypothetical protein
MTAALLSTLFFVEDRGSFCLPWSTPAQAEVGNRVKEMSCCVAACYMMPIQLINRMQPSHSIDQIFIG